VKYKNAPAALTKTAGEFGSGAEVDAGEFEAIVSVFNIRDYDNDVVKPGAFKKSIERWKSGQDTMPVLWHHRGDDPRFNIGAVVDMAEISPGDARIPDWADEKIKANGGLWVKARFDTGDDASDVARHALRVLKARRTTQFSYGYEIPPGGATKGPEVREVNEMSFFEVSPTQLGSNTSTELLGTRSAPPDEQPPQADDARKCWPAAAKASAECALLVADLGTDEISFWSL
jgi:phage head maturation protease